MPKVRDFELGLREWFRTRYAGLLRVIADTGELPPTAEIDEVVKAFKLSRGGLAACPAPSSG